jgi:cytochrome b
MSIGPGKARWVRVWDLPTRLFHWILAGLVVFSWWSGEQGEDWLKWHFLSGFTILALLLYRIAWGLVGSQTARFGDFLKGPRAGLHHVGELLSRRRPQDVGHNPLGGWMVALLLLLLLVQTLTGLFSEDDIATSGPLAGLVSDSTVHSLTRLHHLNVKLIEILVIVHVVAVLAYLLVKRQNLIWPMITGRKRLDLPPGQEPRAVSPWLALAIAIVAGLIVYGVVRLGG